MENIELVLTEIQDAFYDIPFENSHFQNEVFVLSSQITPERAYRALGLRMSAKIRALKENSFNERKNEIRIAELKEQIESTDFSSWDKMRAQLEIEQIESNYSYNNKLKNDAIQELNTLYAHFKALPRFTREQFELAERNHFQQKLTRQVNNITGGVESLINMREDTQALLDYENKVAQIKQADTETLALLRNSMSNQIKETN
jgi:hypothetical protein